MSTTLATDVIHVLSSRPVDEAAMLDAIAEDVRDAGPEQVGQAIRDYIASEIVDSGWRHGEMAQIAYELLLARLNTDDDDAWTAVGEHYQPKLAPTGLV